MKSYRFLMYTIAFCFLASVPSFALDKTIGYVESLSGIWVDHRYKTVLSRHSSIRSDSEIRVETSQADYFIILRIYGLPTPEDYSCSTPIVCASTLDLKDALEKRDQKTLSAYRRVIDALKIVMEPQPIWARPIERASSVDGVQDDVVIADEHEIIVDKLFSDNFARGRYEVAYKTIGNDLPSVKANIEWSGNRRLPLTLDPGMYELQVKQLDATNTVQSPEWRCVILVVARDRYDGIASLMQEGRDYLATFENSNSQEVKTLLRYLMLSIDARRER